MQDAISLNRATETQKKQELASMYIDVDALREQIEYVRMLIERLKLYPRHDRQIRYFVVLYEMLAEMDRKLRTHKSVRLEFWGQP